MPSLSGSSTQENIAGVFGESTLFNGVLGSSTANGHSGVAGVHDEGIGNGVYGRSKNGMGVVGYSSAVGHAGVAGVNDDGKGAGVYGRSHTNEGVRGESTEFNGVLGQSTAPGHAGVAGVSVGPERGNGIYGRSDNGGSGVWGHGNSQNGIGVVGVSDGSGAGVSGVSAGFNGVLGETRADNHAGVAGVCNEGGGNGIYGRSKSGLAGLFEGNVKITESLTVQGSDLLARIKASEDQLRKFSTLETNLTALQSQLSNLQSQANSIQTQLTSLQQKQQSEVEGIATSLITLASRVSALENQQ